MLMRFVVFGVAGIVASLIFTAAKGAVMERRFDFTGQASLVLFPAYGLIAIIYPLISMRIGGMPWYARGAIYMLAFYAAQYLVGLGLSRIDVCPWKYAGKWSLSGLVRAEDAPLWFASGLLVEWFYPLVKSVASSL